MGHISTQDTLGQLVADRPGRSRVFEQYGLDYCCGGKKTLEAASKEKKIEIKDLLLALGESDTARSLPSIDWTIAPLGALADHIANTHHAYLRGALPRLTLLTEKVREAHGKRHPELVELASTFAAFRSELENHMIKEDQVLFPLIKRLESAEPLPAFPRGSVNSAIEVLEAEHEGAGEALETMRALTHNFITPADVCNTYRALMDALVELEADMHRHVHKENSILFPRASALEAKCDAK